MDLLAHIKALNCVAARVSDIRNGRVLVNQFQMSGPKPKHSIVLHLDGSNAAYVGRSARLQDVGPPSDVGTADSLNRELASFQGSKQIDDITARLPRYIA